MLTKKAYLLYKKLSTSKMMSTNTIDIIKLKV